MFCSLLHVMLPYLNNIINRNNNFNFDLDDKNDEYNGNCNKIHVGTSKNKNDCVLEEERSMENRNQASPTSFQGNTIIVTILFWRSNFMHTIFIIYIVYRCIEY